MEEKDKFNTVAGKHRNELYDFEDKIMKQVINLIGEMCPSLTKTVLTKKFGDKTINVTIEIEDPDEPKGIL